MNLQTAQDLLEKFKPLENIAMTKDGSPFHKFVILPLEYIIQNSIELDYYKVFYNEEEFQKNLNDKFDYSLVGIHRSSTNVFAISTDLDYFESLLKLHK